MNNQIKDFLRANKPVPATEEERAILMKVSKKGIYILVAFAIVMVGVWIKEGANIEVLGFLGIFLCVILVIILGLEMKDRIKIKSYRKIYSTYVYVESSCYVNKASHMIVSCYDMDYGNFNKMKMNIDRMDTGGHIIQAGEILRVYVGEKNSKLHYIAMKND